MDQQHLVELWQQDHTRAGLIFGATVVFAGVVLIVARPTMRRLVAKTDNTIDDAIAAAVPGPLALSSLFIGTWYALQPLAWTPSVMDPIRAILLSLAIAMWARAIQRVGAVVLDYLSVNQDNFVLVEARTLPLFDIMARVILWGGAFYLLLLAWDIDVTGWLASAGVLGVAVGFAAQDTVANLFAGLFIVADAPYKLGDFLVIDSQLRGRVTDIGLRSTRLLTKDNVEIVVPNSVMAGARITNESGGPHEHERVGVAVEVSYGSDLDEVRRVLFTVVDDNPYLMHDSEDERPEVLFKSFEGSGIRVDVMGWIPTPELKEKAEDMLVVETWRALKNAGIEIFFPQQEVRVLGSVAMHSVPDDDGSD